MDFFFLSPSPQQNSFKYKDRRNKNEEIFYVWTKKEVGTIQKEKKDRKKKKKEYEKREK